MGKYVIKRLCMALVTIFFVTCLTFLLMNAVPGSPWLSEKTPSEATLAALNAKYGLDQPVPVQLLKYLQNLLHGDFGVSLKMQKNRDVLSIILEMFPVSAKVGAIALCWAVLVGVPLGCLAAFKRGRLTDSFLRVVCTLGNQHTGIGVPLRYNYDKPEKPRRIKGFEVFSLVFSSFSKPKNHTEISRIIGGVSLTTNE